MNINFYADTWLTFEFITKKRIDMSEEDDINCHFFDRGFENFDRQFELKLDRLDDQFMVPYGNGFLGSFTSPRKRAPMYSLPILHYL